MYHGECPKCLGPAIDPACKDCGYDVEDVAREALAERIKGCHEVETSYGKVTEELREVLLKHTEVLGKLGALMIGRNEEIKRLEREIREMKEREREKR